MEWPRYNNFKQACIRKTAGGINHSFLNTIALLAMTAFSFEFTM